jgi:hypothetical protein
MAASPAGSAVFIVVALLTICAAVLLLLRYFLPLRTTPAYVTVPVFLAIVLPASIILLVPVDLASSAGTDTDGNRGIWLSDKVVYKSWRIAYWLTFALTWVILPYLGEYNDSGYRAPRDRLVYALRSNGRYQLIQLGSSLLGMVYYFMWNGASLDSFKGTVMALAYAWGLVFAIYLMGNGLVGLPRTLYRNASISGRLKRLQAHAPKVHDKLTEALDKLDQYEYQVVQLQQRKNGTAKEFQEWIEELGDMRSLPESRVSTVGTTSTATVPPVITERYLADLTRKLKRARHAKMRFSDEWDRLVEKAVQTQAILDSKASKRLEFKNSQFQTPSNGPLSRFAVFTPYTRYHLHVHAVPALLYLSSFLTAIASFCIVWSEVIKDPKLSPIGLTVVHPSPSARSRIGFGRQVNAAAWLGYMCLCAFFSFTEVKIWGNRALVKRGTYLESATWYSLQVAKLTVPLAYNFITFVSPTIYKGTSFYKFLGRLIEEPPLFREFSKYFPVFVIVPVLASLFGLYKRAKDLCGFGDLLEDEAEESNDNLFGTGSWREGRALIDREVNGANGNGNALGLSQRGGGGVGITSPPGERYSDRRPAVAAAANARPNANANVNANPERRPQRQWERRRPPAVDEDESGNFFADFGARVKNTFETADFNFSRPKWLGGDDDEGEGVGRGAGRSVRGGSGGQERSEGFLGLFGGRGDEGRVRL